MKISKEHKKHLKKNDFKLGIYRTDILSERQTDIIKKYGHWFEALTNGTIQPITDEQKRFIDVSKDIKEPVNEYETAWREYLDQKMIEDIPHYNF